MEKLTFKINGNFYRVESKKVVYNNKTEQTVYNLIDEVTDNKIGVIAKSQDVFDDMTMFDFTDTCKDLIGEYEERMKETELFQKAIDVLDTYVSDNGSENIVKLISKLAGCRGNAYQWIEDYLGVSITC